MDNYLEIKKQILDKIKEYDTIIIHRHRRPDGDAIGSSRGLKELIKSSFPNKKVLCAASDSSEYLSFLGKDDKVNDSDYENALVIVVDTGGKDRVSDERFNKGKYLIKIDHHETSEDYCDLNYVRYEQASCADIIADLAMTFKSELVMNTLAATYLFTGIVTDSGRFKYSAAGTDCHIHTAFLLEYNVNVEDIFVSLYVEDKEAFALKKYVYNHYKITQNGVAYIFFKKGSADKLNTTVENISACINMLDSIKGSMIWILFNETKDNIRVRLRSRYIPITKLSEKYQGGGHENACGATLHSRKEIKALLNDFDALLKEYKERNGDKY